MKYSFRALWALIATGSSVHAAILYTDLSPAPVTITPGSSSFVDMDIAQVVTGPAIAGNDLFLAYASFSVEEPSVQSNPSTTSVSGVGGKVFRLNYGDSFTSLSSLAGGGFLDQASSGGFWNATSGEAYVGVIKDGNEGWLRVIYNDAADVFQLTGIAYNTSGTLFAGQTASIPEPATSSAMAAALCALAVPGYRRYRRQK